MSRIRPLRWMAVAAVALLAFSGSAGSAAGGPVGNASIDPWLIEQLSTPASEHLTVLVHAANARAARAAATRAGLTPARDLASIGVTIASGERTAVRAVARQPEVSYVEGDQPLEYFLDTSHKATRSASASALWSSRHRGQRLDGTGVSVAVIDTGIDPTHTFFKRPDGKSAVVANLKNACGIVISHPDNCFVDVGARVDTDTVSAGGHGTHVNGIVAGQPRKLADGTTVRGVAPGARLVSLSVGAGISVVNAEMALDWVLQHRSAPCGAGVSKTSCPPIKVLNNSWGPAGGGDFNAKSGIAKLQRALAAKGVVTVWANGNDDGKGTDNRSNPHGQDPTAGIISVASYFDRDTGTRQGDISGYSSRGDRARTRTWPDISAPGEDITSSCRAYLWICSTGGDPRNGSGVTEVAAFNTISGTSMAAPHIAGIVAQLFQAKRSATPFQIEHALKATAYRYRDGASYRDIGRYVSSYDKGTGLVDVVAAVAKLTR